jgi:ribonuclease P protein component
VGLKKSFRVKKKQDFNAIFHAKHSMANRAFIVYQLPHEDLTHFRLGLSVSKKLGHAHTRVLIKRRLREIMRQLAPELLPRDIVIIARPGVENMTFAELQKNLQHILKKSQLLEKNT